MTMLEQIKLLSGGINGTLYDDAINSTIEVARADLIRAGVSESLANASDDLILPLIRSAIVMYGISQHSTDSKECERAEKAYSYQLDNLRKSNGYMEDDDDTE